MTADDELFGPGRLRAFAPYLAPAERRQLHALLDGGASSPPSFAEALRALARRYIDDGDSVKLRAVCLLVADLCEQGWRVVAEPDRIVFEPPGIVRGEQQNAEDIKARVRQTLQIARLRQLREPSVRQFLTRLERKSMRAAGKRASITDLIDDGAALAASLRRINASPEAKREAALAQTVDPVIEVCEAGARCTETGLLLNDIWRYFRHTWAHEYRSIPGRQLHILVRNAARPFRPIMGIAMLASPIMRLAPRDRWIGWIRDEAEARVKSGEWPALEFASALLDRLEASLGMVRWDDLATPAEIASPTDTVPLRLEQKAAGAAFARDAQLRSHYEAQQRAGGPIRSFRGNLTKFTDKTDWRAASEDFLFLRKRAGLLAQLLSAKQVLCAFGLAADPASALPRLFADTRGQHAIEIALAEFRKAGLSSEVADLSICGAVHPYNSLLAGKLVALLLTSHEVRTAYARRYGEQVSVIASQMAGRPISKPAGLRILTTTSLYGIGSSQYNRLTLRADDHHLPHDIRWSAIGRSLTGGFGTLHLGADTAQALRGMAETRHDARRVNNRFGEGTSPRMRQIREGLDALGLKSDAILHHATPRIFYGCELSPGARSALVGLSNPSTIPPTAAAIAHAWQQRWLSKRVRREETLAELAHLGPTSVRASLHADAEGQFLLPFEST